jgi:hypothetical protein
VPHFQLVTVDGDVLGATKLGRPDWPPERATTNATRTRSGFMVLVVDGSVAEAGLVGGGDRPARSPSPAEIGHLEWIDERIQIRKETL